MLIQNFSKLPKELEKIDDINKFKNAALKWELLSVFYSSMNLFATPDYAKLYD